MTTAAEDATPATVAMPQALTGAFATWKEETNDESYRENDESHEEEEPTEDEGLTPGEERVMRLEIAGIAERMFGARIVSRVPHDAQKREVKMAEVTA